MGPWGSEGHTHSPHQVHVPSCHGGASVCESWYGSNRTPLPSSESTPSPGSIGFSSLSQNPPLLPKCLRGREVLTLAVGGFCHLSLSQVVWNQSQKCEGTLGEGVPEGPHRHKFKRCPVHLVLCLFMERRISFLVSVVQMKSGYWKRGASSPFQSALGRRICCMEPLILELGLDLCLAGS